MYQSISFSEEMNLYVTPKEDLKIKENLKLLLCKDQPGMANWS